MPLYAVSTTQYNRGMTSVLEATLAENRLVRITGRDPTVDVVMASAVERLAGVVSVLTMPNAPNGDYAQIDAALHIEPARLEHPEHGAPRPGVGYAGLTPRQRGEFLWWLRDPRLSAPAAFQALYLAQLEVGLLEGAVRTPAIVRELSRLGRAPAWRAHDGLARAALLAYWLTQDGAGLAAWIAETPPPPSLLGVALGCQARLGIALGENQLGHVLTGWQLVEANTSLATLTPHLRSLTTNLDADPLAYALAALGDAAAMPRPWRATHRGVRVAFPQPDIKPGLLPLLAEVMRQSTAPAATPPVIQQTYDSTPPSAAVGWHLVLEFGHSRSEPFRFALSIAQRMPGFSQLLDENRKLVYRVIFKKSEMRNFWRLWDYVQSWSSTHIYLNGQELEKWKVFPYSQYLR